MERLLLTPVEAAQALSIGRSKVYELMGDGSLRSVKIGRSRRVSGTAIRDFLHALETSGT